MGLEAQMHHHLEEPEKEIESTISLTAVIHSEVIPSDC
jgi:hypothetical protein